MVLTPWRILDSGQICLWLLLLVRYFCGYYSWSDMFVVITPGQICLWLLLLVRYVSGYYSWSDMFVVITPGQICLWLLLLFTISSNLLENILSIKVQLIGVT